MDNNKNVNQLCYAYYVISTAAHSMTSIVYLSPEISVSPATTLQDFFFKCCSWQWFACLLQRRATKSFPSPQPPSAEISSHWGSLSIKLHAGTIDPPLAIADWPRGGD